MRDHVVVQMIAPPSPSLISTQTTSKMIALDIKNKQTDIRHVDFLGRRVTYSLKASECLQFILSWNT